MSGLTSSAAVWIGTRFSASSHASPTPHSQPAVCAEEAGASPAHQKAVLGASHESTIRTIIFTVRVHSTAELTAQGRPLRVEKNPFIVRRATRAAC